MEHDKETQISTQNKKTTNQESLKCKFCSRMMSSKQSLKEHTSIHTGEKTYKCPEPGCTKAFRQGSLLSIHRKIHSEIKKSLLLHNSLCNEGQYIQLTKHTIFISDSRFILNKNEIDSIKEKISSNDYNFIEQYINKYKY